MPTHILRDGKHQLQEGVLRQFLYRDHSFILPCILYQVLSRDSFCMKLSPNRLEVPGQECHGMTPRITDRPLVLPGCLLNANPWGTMMRAPG